MVAVNELYLIGMRECEMGNRAGPCVAKHFERNHRVLCKGLVLEGIILDVIIPWS